MKKLILSLILVIFAGTILIGCNRNNAVWLEDGKTLEVIDNTLGEGEAQNVRFVHTYKNSVVEEGKGYVYILPISENNPTVRYFASIKQGTNSELVEITGIKTGDIITEDNLLTSEWADFWNQGMEFIDGKSTATHYSNVVTTTKYCYAVSKNNNLTVWGDKYLAVTITSSIVSAVPITFTIEMKNSTVMPLLLSHKGDSWQIK